MLSIGSTVSAKRAARCGLVLRLCELWPGIDVGRREPVLVAPGSRRIFAHHPDLSWCVGRTMRAS